jgi:hypothetical protein
MKGGNTDSKAGEVQGFDYENVERYGSVDLKGGNPKKGKSSKSSKFSEFDFEKEWKEFEQSYNQKYGGAKKKTSSKKAPAKKASSTKKPAKKASSTKKPKRKTQKGGDESGATFAPAQMFDEKATMSAPPAGPFQSAYGTIKAVDGLDRNLAPYPNSSGQLTGGAKKKVSKAKKDTKKPKTATKTTKPKKDDKKKDSKKDDKKDSKKDTKKTGKKESVLDKIKKFFAM